VMIATIDQRNADVRIAQRPGGGEPAKAAADDDNVR